ncbi:MAG: hypothetical protein ACREC9_03465 [Methylocella sp.]
MTSDNRLSAENRRAGIVSPGQAPGRLHSFGLHGRFGAYINRAVLPASLEPLVTRPGLRRSAGNADQIDTAGTQFPKQFRVERG